MIAVPARMIVPRTMKADPRSTRRIRASLSRMFSYQSASPSAGAAAFFLFLFLGLGGAAGGGSAGGAGGSSGTMAAFNRGLDGVAGGGDRLGR
jgi:hypothetical protein